MAPVDDEPPPIEPRDELDPLVAPLMSVDLDAPVALVPIEPADRPGLIAPALEPTPMDGEDIVSPPAASDVGAWLPGFTRGFAWLPLWEDAAEPLFRWAEAPTSLDEPAESTEPAEPAPLVDVAEPVEPVLCA